MKWIKWDADCIESEDGLYSIDRARMGGGVERFTSWFRGAKPSENLGCFDTAEEARERCQAHAEGRYQPPGGEVYRP